MSDLLHSLIAWAHAMPMLNALALLIIAHFLDIATTDEGLSLGSVEGNPVARWFMEISLELGYTRTDGLVAMKLLATVLVWFFSPDAVPILVIAAGTFLIAWHNYTVIVATRREQLQQDLNAKGGK